MMLGISDSASATGFSRSIRLLGVGGTVVNDQNFKRRTALYEDGIYVIDSGCLAVIGRDDEGDLWRR